MPPTPLQPRRQSDSSPPLSVPIGSVAIPPGHGLVTSRVVCKEFILFEFPDPSGEGTSREEYSFTLIIDAVSSVKWNLTVSLEINTAGPRLYHLETSICGEAVGEVDTSTNVKLKLERMFKLWGLQKVLMISSGEENFMVEAGRPLTFKKRWIHPCQLGPAIPGITMQLSPKDEDPPSSAKRRRVSEGQSSANLQ